MASEDDSSLAAQCMAFCQALANQGKEFQFSLNIGSAFSFTLDTRCKDTLASTAKKRVSPSTLRRNAKRREEFLKQKLKPATEREKIVTEKESTIQSSTFQCDQCDNIFKTESGLKIHIGKSHKLPPTEKVRDDSKATSLPVSPLKDTTRSIACHNCGEDMLPSHICDEVKGDSDVEDEVNENNSEAEKKCAKAGCCHCHHPPECECWREGPERDCELDEYIKDNRVMWEDRP